VIPEDMCMITGNAGKAAEFASMLGVNVRHQTLDIFEIQALDVAVVVRSKAEQAYAKLRKPVLTDDSCMIIDAWNGLPGALTSWFLDAVGTSGILRMAASINNRSARAITALGYADATGVRVFVGEVKGRLAEVERGTAGFGYDSIFIPENSDRTFAELSVAEKRGLSMRQRAVDAFLSAI
jgi:non-canonical purine NTP pyrophosphatase (RdgB/HAM1 family)